MACLLALQGACHSRTLALAPCSAASLFYINIVVGSDFPPIRLLHEYLLQPGVELSIARGSHTGQGTLHLAHLGRYVDDRHVRPHVADFVHRHSELAAFEDGREYLCVSIFESAVSVESSTANVGETAIICETLRERFGIPNIPCLYLVGYNLAYHRVISRRLSPDYWGREP